MSEELIALQGQRQPEPSDLRADLVRRLFAVAISVGVAFTLSRMGWVVEGRLPTLGEWEQLAILVAAMTATVLSWDGYLVSVGRRPLNGALGYWRYCIDICLVFTYMFLLMTSIHKTWWIYIHTLTFGMYIIWDFLSVLQYTSQYTPPLSKSRFNEIIGVYTNGVRGVSASSGPIITILWFFYFVILTYLNYGILEDRIFVTAFFAFIGLALYRLDKIFRFIALLRPIVIAVLILADVIYISYGTNFRDPQLHRFVGSLFE